MLLCQLLPIHPNLLAPKCPSVHHISSCVCGDIWEFVTSAQAGPKSAVLRSPPKKFPAKWRVASKRAIINSKLHPQRIAKFRWPKLIEGTMQSVWLKGLRKICFSILLISLRAKLLFRRKKILTQRNLFVIYLYIYSLKVCYCVL